MKTRKYIATRDIFVPASHRKNPTHFIRIKKGRVIKSEWIDGKEVIQGTTTKIYYYLRTGALLRGTKLSAKSKQNKNKNKRNNSKPKTYKKPQQ